MIQEQQMQDQIEGSLYHQKEEYDIIQEYRIASAEKAGINIAIIDESGIWTDDPRIAYAPNPENHELIMFELWQPDKDANQREMIEDWLIKQGYCIELIRHSKDEVWRVIIWEGNKYKVAEDKSKSTAFMKAFMEYIKQTK